MKSQNSSFDEIRGILRELSISRKETDEQIKKVILETNKQMKETDEKIEKVILETNKQMKETDEKIEKAILKTNKQIEKTSLQLQQTGSRFNEKWGKFVEALVEGNLEDILKSKKIEVQNIHTRSKGKWKKPNGKLTEKEIDILAVNGKEIVAVEVKKTLEKQDIYKFLEVLENFKNYFKDYKMKTIYGAMGYLESQPEVRNLAQEQGLFVIKAAGNAAKMINEDDFKPRAFS